MKVEEAVQLQEEDVEGHHEEEVEQPQVGEDVDEVGCNKSNITGFSTGDRGRCCGVDTRDMFNSTTVRFPRLV